MTAPGNEQTPRSCPDRLSRDRSLAKCSQLNQCLAPLGVGLAFEGTAHTTGAKGLTPMSHSSNGVAKYYSEAVGLE